MDGLFLKVLEMSLAGSIAILITMLARFLLRNRSKKFIMILWAVVAFRLLVPFSFESSLSFFNYIPLKTQTITAGSQVQDAAIPDNSADTQVVTADYAAVTEKQDIIPADNNVNETLSGNLQLQKLYLILRLYFQQYGLLVLWALRSSVLSST